MRPEWVLDAGLAALVEGNARAFGPCATALRILDITLTRRLEPEATWMPLLLACPRLAPLGYWLQALRAGGDSAKLVADHQVREETMVRALVRLLGKRQRVLLVGHDHELDTLWRHDANGRTWRYLLLDGPPGTPAAGGDVHTWRPAPAHLPPPFPFAQVEDALDWADAVVLAGFVLHRWNILGPPQLRPLLASARDQVELVALCALNERRLVLGMGAPHEYRDDFRPYLWQHHVTHLVSEWTDGHAGTVLGWLPADPETLDAQLGGIPLASGGVVC